MSPVAACTIASNNYLAFARVFAESYRRHHPGTKVFVCIVDTPHTAVPYDEMPFEPIFAHQLEIPSFHNFAFRYDILELNTAVKPYLLSHLRDRFDLDRIFYFDPDILICDQLTGLIEALEKNDAVLTPHITHPLEDEHHPSERALLQCGVYNLGFVGMRLDKRTAEFLEWWQKRLHRFCLVDPPSGLFVDQSWMALAPAFLDSVAIARDPIYNIAYWNLAYRNIETEPGPWKVNGQRIGFVHFSGIHLKDLETVSRHQDRLTLDQRPDVRPCFEHYRDLVLAAGHEDLCELPYSYDTFRDSDIDVPLTARWALQRVDPGGRRWPNPFELEGDDTFYQWLVEPLEFERGYLNRLAISLWEDRPDLSSNFPRVVEEDLPNYVGWLKAEAEVGRLEPLFAEGAAVKPPPAMRVLSEPPKEDLVRGLIHGLVSFDQPRGLLSWLNESVEDSAEEWPTITRLAMMLYKTRDDVQNAWPDPLGEDRLSFASWFITDAREAYKLPVAAVEPVALTVTPEIRRSAEKSRDERGIAILRDLVDLRHPAGLAEWLNEPVGDAGEQGPAITRLAMTLYEMRDDVQIEWSDPLGRNRQDLAYWFCNDAPLAYRLPAALVTRVEETLSPKARKNIDKLRSERGVEVLGALVDLGQPAGLAEWLNEPVPDAAEQKPLVTRLAMMLYEMREDVQETWPEPLGRNQLDFALWFISDARRAYRLPPVLTAPVENSLPSPGRGGLPETTALPITANPALKKAPIGKAARRRRQRRRLVRGVNLAGYFSHPTGVGQMGRASASVLERTGIPFARVSLDLDPAFKTFRRTIHQPEGLPYAVTLINANADETPYALQKMPLVATVKSYKIGYWYWELSHFPLAFADRFPLLDEIWAGSRFCKESFDVISTLPVRHVPPFVRPPHPATNDRSSFGLDDNRFIFFYAFDAGSIPERKNPFAAIEAIRRLRLATRKPVGLFLKMSRTKLDPHLMPRLRREAEGQPVTFYTDTAPLDVVYGMVSSCDAILSLHRSEGLGLIPIEGLYLEKPVVATSYGGVMDYFDETTGFPVEYRLRPLGEDHPPYPRGSVWANPSIDDAVEQMLRVVEEPGEARKRAVEGRRRIEGLYGLDAAAKRFTVELERIFDLLEANPPPQTCRRGTVTDPRLHTGINPRATKG